MDTSTLEGRTTGRGGRRAVAAPVRAASLSGHCQCLETGHSLRLYVTPLWRCGQWRQKWPQQACRSSLRRVNTEYPDDGSTYLRMCVRVRVCVCARVIRLVCACACAHALAVCPYTLELWAGSSSYRMACPFKPAGDGELGASRSRRARAHAGTLQCRLTPHTCSPHHRPHRSYPRATARACRRVTTSCRTS